MSSDLERRFHNEMLGIYREAAKLGYRASYFHQMVGERGGLQAALDLLHKTQVSEGFTKLYELGRLDLSMENLVRQEPWCQLFTEEEIAIAEKRLKKLRFLDE